MFEGDILLFFCRLGMGNPKKKGTKINNWLILYKFTFKAIAQGWHAARWAQGIKATATL